MIVYAQPPRRNRPKLIEAVPLTASIVAARDPRNRLPADLLPDPEADARVAAFLKRMIQPLSQEQK